METYLLFFGKSQDFTFEAYTEAGLVEDFNQVIKNFSLLESDWLNVDEKENEPMLARYYFSDSGKQYSLIKLYSFAQALNGDRVAGSIFGVALLSERNLALSEFNIQFLNEAKEAFAKISLNGRKFNKSNFEPDSSKIWELVQNRGYFDQISFQKNAIKASNEQKPALFWVKNLEKDPVSLDASGNLDKVSKVYFSEDLAHLKRTVQQHPSLKFYHQKGNSYVAYEEEVVKPKKPEVVPESNYEKPERTTPPVVEHAALPELSALKKVMQQQNKQHNLQLYLLAGFLVLISLLGYYKVYHLQKVIIALQEELTQTKSQLEEVLQNSISVPIKITPKPEPKKEDVESLPPAKAPKKEESAKKKEQKSAPSLKPKAKTSTPEKAKAKPEAEKEKEADKEPAKDKLLIEKQN
jgi:hypothetical protein